MFIGREKELKFLQDKYDEKKGHLIVLYGRRRVGKTETLKEFCKHKPHIFYSCTQSTDRVQLAKFSKQILREDIPAKQYISEFTDWEKAVSLDPRSAIWRKEKADCNRRVSIYVQRESEYPLYSAKPLGYSSKRQ